MRKITMLETTPGSPNGAIVLTYEKGFIGEIPDDLARAFVDEMKVAKDYEEGDEDGGDDNTNDQDATWPPKPEDVDGLDHGTLGALLKSQNATVPRKTEDRKAAIRTLLATQAQ